jgi:hypothetical protein
VKLSAAYTHDFKMSGFHGDPEIKRSFINRVRQHRLNDDFASGFFKKDGKGCSVGLTVHESDVPYYHFEQQIGVPEILAKHNALFFEALWQYDRERALTWPERFLESIACGADLTTVWPQMAIWSLLYAKDGVLSLTRDQAAHVAIVDTADLFQKWLTSSKPEYDEWQAARSVAEVAGVIFLNKQEKFICFDLEQVIGVFGCGRFCYTATSFKLGLKSPALRDFFVRASNKLLELMGSIKPE